MSPDGNAAHAAGFDLGLHDAELDPDVRARPKAYAEESFPYSGLPESDHNDFVRGYVAGVGGPVVPSKPRATTRTAKAVGDLREMAALRLTLTRAREATRKLVTAKWQHDWEHWSAEELDALVTLCKVLGVDIDGEKPKEDTA